ncbi:class I fructose-bisphosphate aldolase [Pseudonocardia autotrophica]|uniref:class I fructose-bisphosphate aldolase n=2 Tax=Pseudonocardiaceae TaxID=2070 RepID=UPI0038CDB3EC
MLTGRVSSEAAGWPASDSARRNLVRLVLGTPNLQELVGGVTVDTVDLHGRDRVGAAVSLAATMIPIGVRMGGQHPRLRGAAHADPARAVARHAEAGATFARWRITSWERHRDLGLGARCRAAAEWAGACLRGGLTPVIDCVVRVADVDGIDRVERVHSRVVCAAVEALRSAGADVAATVIGATVVTPGRRRLDAEVHHVARMTMHSLRRADARLAGVVLTSVVPDPRMVAYVGAVHWMRPEWPVGFCLGRSVLEPAARIWRGEAGRGADAQRHVAAELSRVAAVLRVGRAEVTRREGRAWWNDRDEQGVRTCQTDSATSPNAIGRCCSTWTGRSSGLGNRCPAHRRWSPSCVGAGRRSGT